MTLSASGDHARILSTRNLCLAVLCKAGGFQKRSSRLREQVSTTLGDPVPGTCGDPAPGTPCHPGF